MSETAAPVSSNINTSPITPPTPAVEVKASEAPKSLKVVKVDGKEIQLDETTYHNFVQKGIGAEKRFAEAQKIQKQIEQRAEELNKREAQLSQKEKMFSGSEEEIDRLVQSAQGDPQKLAKVRDRVEKWLVSQIRAEQASPEEQARLAAEKRAQEAENRLKQRDDDDKKKVLDSRIEHFKKQYEMEIIQTLDVGGLPPTEENVRRVAEKKAIALKGGYELSPEAIAQRVKADIVGNSQAITKEYVTSITEAHKANDPQRVMLLGESLSQLVGPELLNALRLYDLTKLKNSQPIMPKPIIETPRVKPPTEETRAYKMTWEQEIDDRKKRAAELDAEWRNRVR